MKKRSQFEAILTIALLALLVILVTSCNKKEAPTAPNDLTAIAYEDHIRLSWDRVPNTDYYRISVDFLMTDNNNQISRPYNVFLGETTSTNYIDLYPFEGMNRYIIQAVNEYGSSSYSEVSCYYPEITPRVYLYPNPATDGATVCFADESIPFCHFTVNSHQGQEVMDWNFSGNLYIDTRQFDEGIYLIHLYPNNNEVVKRFVVTHTPIE